MSTEADLLHFVQEIRTWGSYVAYDTETDGLNIKKSNIIGIAISDGIGKGVYIPTRYWCMEEKALKHFFSPRFLDAALTTIYEELGIRQLLMHNAAFDIPITYENYGVDLTAALWADTIPMKHLLDEEFPFGLKELAAKYARFIGIPPDELANQEQVDMRESIKRNGGSLTKDNYELYKADWEIIGKYAAADVDLTFRLFCYLESELIRTGRSDFFYKHEVMPLMKYGTLVMRMGGIFVDVPYLTEYRDQCLAEAKEAEAKLLELWAEPAKIYEEELLAKQAPISRAGLFAKFGLKHYGLPVPTDDKGKETLAKKALTKLRDSYASSFLDWLLWDAKKPLGPEPVLDPEAVSEIRRMICEHKKISATFNISSNDQLGWLFFKYYKEPTDNAKKSKKTGKISVDKDELARYQHIPGVTDLLKLRKVLKQLSTYILPILAQQINGWLYPNMLQHGTTSGRYSCHGINLQTLPRDDKRIKKAFKAPEGYSFVSADFASLEPRIFSAVCSDPGLVAIFLEGLDFYSKIAIDVYDLPQYSANEKDPNYLKKIAPEFRQSTKQFCFTENTNILTDLGTKKICNLVVGDRVMTKQGYKTVTHTFCREAEVMEFATNRGGFKCTPDHKIWNVTKNEWCEAELFPENDEVELISPALTQGELQFLPVFANVTLDLRSAKPLYKMPFDENWAWMLGAFLGDGLASYTNRKDRKAKNGSNSHLITSYVGMCGHKDDEVVNEWGTRAQAFGFNVTDSGRKDKNMIYARVHAAEFTKLFQSTFKAFVLPKTSDDHGRKNLRIQDFVFNSTKNVRLAFLAGLLDTDGYVKGHSKKKVSDVAFCTKSFELATDFVELCKSLGCNPTLRLDWNKTYERYYYVINFRQPDIYHLAEQNIQQFMTVDRKRNAFIHKLNCGLTYEREINLPVHVKKLRSGVETVYDITVDEVHEFYANGIRVHNCLAVPYGANAYLLAMKSGRPVKEHQKEIDDYLDSYPQLKEYMRDQERSAYENGFVKTRFGRIRHLPRAKKLYDEFGKDIFNKTKMALRFGGKEAAKAHAACLEYREQMKHPRFDFLLQEPVDAKLQSEFKELEKQEKKFRTLVEKYGEEGVTLYGSFRNAMNNAKNSPIQMTAAHVTNAAMILVQKRIYQEGLDAWICLTIHDEIVILCNDRDSLRVKFLLQDSMENNWVTRKIPLPILAEPAIGPTLADVK